MKHFKTLLSGLSVRASAGDLETRVLAPQSDTRRIVPGSVFVAVKDAYHDGPKWVADAIEKGAAALILGEAPESELPVPWVVVPHPGHALAVASANFHGNPTRKLDLIGITGTSGKTTTAALIHAILTTAGRNAGLFGTTVGAEFAGKAVKTGLTTPESPELQAILADWQARGCDTATMEVSSHGIALKRVAACDFAVGVFTGLGQDHLDFHEDLDDYGETKINWLLGDVQRSKRCKGVVVPEGDDWADQVHAEFRGNVMTFGFSEEADVYPPHLELTATGTRGRIHTPDGTLTLDLKLPGRHNVKNAMAAICTAILLGIQPIDIVDGLSRVRRVPGRLEPVANDAGLAVFVDYAHKPDALLAVIASLREIVPAGARLIVVFGCGGDRDRQKRPEMGRIAYENADIVVITSDNPRSEAPLAIIDEIALGTPPDAEPGRVHIEVDRRAAIELALLDLAEPGDVILIAGKGHETGQIVGTEVRPFDDRVVAAEILAQLAGQGTTEPPPA
jgi:UDP-N-acetylmuramoyl-L-alanyl-D-glutamate--2,6-diaminopimelate ligase